jgi:hypothetical protein
MAPRKNGCFLQRVQLVHLRLHGDNSSGLGGGLSSQLRLRGGEGVVRSLQRGSEVSDLHGVRGVVGLVSSLRGGEGGLSGDLSLSGSLSGSLSVRGDGGGVGEDHADAVDGRAECSGYFFKSCHAEYQPFKQVQDLGVLRLNESEAQSNDLIFVVVAQELPHPYGRAPL